MLLEEILLLLIKGVLDKRAVSPRSGQDRFPGTIHFVSSRDRLSPTLLLCVSQTRSPVLDTQLVPFVLTLNQEANTTGALLSIESPVEYTLRLTYLPPFPAICPGTIRC